ncbi:uncharacterized protein LOC125681900 isoform X3 [Ostrea edulis]|uniref:uncharacterized protein LOC125681900 isoform X3 n=1 Tax=Ostrea edulis TaxID=37623 RepID=UPI0024AFD104|nr:uncharacterized protein LOC125681900 isoform X3 [Ostrea edulis]
MKGVLVYLILSSLAIILLTADGKEWCVDTRHNITDCHELNLFCKEGYVISKIELFAGNEDCNLRSRCKGLSPVTQSDAMSCYWKQNCSVKIPAQRMVFFHNTITPFKQKASCFVTPKSFHVTRLSCTNLKTSDVRNICPQNGKSVVSVEKRGPSMGIIRSHDLWPWNYPENQTSCSLTFAYPLSPKMSYSTRLTIANLDINANHHLFVTKGKRKEVKEDVKKTCNIRIRHIKSNVKIAFVTNSQNPTSSGKGFVICYRQMKRKRGKGKKKGRTKKTRNKRTKNKRKGRQSRAKRKARNRKNACESVMEPMDLNDDTIRLQAGNSTGYGCQSTDDEYHYFSF